MSINATPNSKSPELSRECDTIKTKTEMLEEELAVSSVLSEFFDANPAETLLPSATILLKLITNALKIPSRDIYRRIRLSNPKIQENVVGVSGAIDILGVAGFVRISLDGEELLIYMHDAKKNVEERGGAICNQIKAKILELKCQTVKNEALDANKRLRPSPTEATPEFPRLSEKELKARLRKEKAARKVREAERAATRRRWEEDKKDREERNARKEHVKSVTLAGDTSQGVSDCVKTGIQIRPTLAQERENIEISSTSGHDQAAAERSLRRDTVSEETDAKETIYYQRHAASKARAEAAAKRAIAKDAMKQKLADGMLPADENDRDNHKKPVTSLNLSPCAAKISLREDKKTTVLQQRYVASEAQAEASAKRTAATNTLKQIPLEVEQSVKSEKKRAASSTLSPDNVGQYRRRKESWEKCMETLPRCAASEGIRESSVFFGVGQKHASGSLASSGGNVTDRCLKRLLKELNVLSSSLPCDMESSAWVRFDEETPQYIRALLAAPFGTPYAGGLFAFDIYIPDDYPSAPPKVVLLTTGGGTVRFGPNLYADGKVCLSLLGTWPGPKWDPKHSSLHQLLISIQGLVLGVEHPYFLEPGHGGWEGEVKTGDFASTGRNLKGEEVTEDIFLPHQVRAYDNLLRVGSVRFAMIDAIQTVTQLMGEGKREGDVSKQFLKPFADPIRIHFHYNHNKILSEVRSWLKDWDASSNSPGKSITKRDQQSIAFGSAPMQQDNSVSAPQTLFEHLLPRLEAALESMPSASFPPESDKGSTKKVSLVLEEKTNSSVAVTRNDTTPSIADPANATSCASVAGGQNNKINNGALVNTMIGTGETSVFDVSDLQQRMCEAAAASNFILAGKLQEQLHALNAASDDDTGSINAEMEKDGGTIGNGSWDDYDDEADSDDDEEMGWSGGAGVPPFAGGPSYASGDQTAFLPPGYEHEYVARGCHMWGTGYQLGAVAEPGINVEVETTTKTAAVTKKKGSSCHLRIRLPKTSITVTKQFDASDALSDVYQWLEPQISTSPRPVTPPRLTQALGISYPNDGSQMVAVAGGAFSRPLSSAGFTLLLSRPKREFSLEMHGTKALSDLGLAPSATLTVMMCSDRGVVLRGALEGRLDEAQGDAMDVDGLTYEALNELTERVGPGRTDRLNGAETDKEILEKNSILISPADYLVPKSTSTSDNTMKECHCPICLGEFDPNDHKSSLRKLTNCSHVFHEACLATWLETKSTCPICKQYIDLQMTKP